MKFLAQRTLVRVRLQGVLKMEQGLKMAISLRRTKDDGKH